MKSRGTRIWDELNSSFWFVPTLMVAIAILLSFLTLALDITLRDAVTEAFGYSRGPEGARSLLSAVASSAITVAGLTFSITIATLTMAASQFGSRLLRNFMRDSGNRLVLGTFVATFIYCLLILRTVNGTGGSEFVPQISVTFSLMLAVASIGVLIYFIHHISSSLQADQVVVSASRRLNETIDRLFPAKEGENNPQEELNDTAIDRPEIFDQMTDVVRANKSGYVQTIVLEKLLHLASEHDLLVRVRVQHGDFVVQRRQLLTLRPTRRIDDRLKSRLNEVFIIGERRTTVQDIEYAIYQLVEVGVRALSTGINNPFTAISCIDWLKQAILHLGARKLPSSYHYDKKGTLRVITEPMTYAFITNAAFNQIREAASTYPLITLYLLETIVTIAAETSNKELHTELLRHARLIEKKNQRVLSNDADQQRIEELSRKIALISLVR